MLRTAAYLLALVSLSVICTAQINNGNNTGVPENGIFNGTQIESVQLNNRNLHIEIPVWSAKGRGLSSGYKYVYDNKRWRFRTICSPNGFCTDTVIGGAPIGLVGPFGYIIKRSSKLNVPCPPIPASSHQYSYDLEEPNGTKHHFAPDPVGPVGNSCNVPTPNMVYASDGSGWALKIDNSSGAVLALYDKNGTKYNSPLTTITDTNGNQLTSDTSVFPPIQRDTLGRTFSNDGSYSRPDGTVHSLAVTNTSVSIQTALCSFSGADTCTEASGTSTLPHIIQFPNGMSFTLNYVQGSHGEPSSLTLPTGGQISWSWSAQATSLEGREVTSRTVTANGQSATWNYTKTASYLQFRDPAGNEQAVYCSTTIQPHMCHISKIEYFSGLISGGNKLKTVVTDFTVLSGGSTNDTVLPTRETTTWHSQNLVTKVETAYDSVNPWSWFTYSWKNPIEKREYAWGTGAPGGLVRKTTLNYLHLQNATYKGINIADRPTTVSIYDGSGNLKAQTITDYDQTTLTGTTGAPSRDAAYGTGYTTRGNPTYIKRWRNTDGAYLWTTNWYDDLGNLRQTNDPLNHPTYFRYSDSWANAQCTLGGTNTQAFVTETENALGHLTRTQYNRCTSLAEIFKDQNDINAARAYGKKLTYDNMFRLSRIDLSDGGWTTNSYNNAVPYTITTISAIDSTKSSVSQEVRDGMGRLRKTKLTEPGTSFIYTFATYDLLGRKQYEWNPSRCDQEFATSCTGESTFGKTEFQYDALGRLRKTIKQDGNFTESTYDANTRTVFDEMGKKRFLRSDALGRLEAGGEPDAGGTFVYWTYYTHDTLDNLAYVEQRGNAASTQWRNRSFTYNSLSQLLTANNPETGTITYSYDNDGSIYQKIDARSVTTTHNPDALHRVLSKSFSDGTATRNFTYDSHATIPTTNAVGRLVVDGDSNSQSAFSYDPLGRVVEQKQWLPPTRTGGPHSITAHYDLAGNLDWVTYPSGRKVTFAVDAANRLNQVKFDSFSGTAVNYTYWSVPATVGSLYGFHPSGSTQYTDLGNSIREQTPESVRLRPAGSYIFNNANGLIFADRAYTFQANGNMSVVADYRNPGRTQNFTYDQFNRLATAYTDTSTGADAWGQSFTYDPWGNLTAQTATKGTPPAFSASALTNNRLSGYSYDAAGNLLNDGVHGYTYNAENQITTVDAGAWSYSYDAGGSRVRKQNAGNTQSTDYIYFGSEVMAERSQAGDWTDYVYANGERIAKADSFEDKVRIRGTNSAASQYSGFTIASAAGYAGYVIQSGDKLYLRQYQVGASRGGMILSFTNGTSTNWNTTDQDGHNLNNDAVSGGWHQRRVDLSSHAGKSLQKIDFVSESTTPIIAWEIAFKDVVLVSADGTVRPIFTGQSSISTTNWGSAGVTGKSATVVHQGGIGQYADAGTSYYHADHLGSSRLTTGYGGWPVWQATYLPFGWEYNQQTAQPSHHQKFTGKERDAESGLDYFGARYYAASMGRFTSTDPKSFFLRHLMDPQKLNKYTYVLNNPLKFVDPNGMEERTITVTTWIPRSTISVFAPFTEIGFGIRTFKGDADGKTFRTKQSVTIETDPSKKALVKQGKPQAGESIEVDSKGKEIGRAHAKGDTLKESVSREGTNTNVSISGNESNPLLMSPGITFDFNFKFSPDGSFTMTGDHDGFPAYRVEVTSPNGSSEVYVHNPNNTGEGGGSLLPPAEHHVEKDCDPKGQCG